jgi:predicted transcriptional regulator
MVDDPSHVRLPRIMALPSIILIPPPESPLVESIARKPYHFVSQADLRLTIRPDLLHLLYMSINSEEFIPTTVLSVRVLEDLKEPLEYLSRSAKRTKTYLATQALGDYVKKNAWRATELHKAIKEANKGVFIFHEAMLAWVDSLGADKELAPPKPDIRRPRKRL